MACGSDGRVEILDNAVSSNAGCLLNSGSSAGPSTSGSRESIGSSTDTDRKNTASFQEDETDSQVRPTFFYGVI